MRVPIGAAAALFLSTQEETIARTLEELVPTAGRSYRQATSDLQNADRVSWKGTAMEFREALRECLDHLAPDAEVMAVKGFQPAPNQTRPTMAQKVRFVLRARGSSSATIESAESAVEVAEAAIAAATRATYTRGSVAGHVGASQADVRRLKRYADAVLSDLLAL